MIHLRIRKDFYQTRRDFVFDEKITLSQNFILFLTFSSTFTHVQEKYFGEQKFSTPGQNFDTLYASI